MSNPTQIWNSWFEISTQAVRLGWEAQNVIALRVMRMAAGGARGEAEAHRMVSEKFVAMSEAQAAATAAALTGGNPQRVAQKVLGVYKKRVRGNKRRLAR